MSRRIGLGLLLLALAGCDSGGGSQNTDTGVDSTFSSLYAERFATSCTGCHGAGGETAASDAGTVIDLSTAALAYQTLVSDGANAVGSSIQGLCNVALVSPGNPSQSYLAAIFASEYNTSDFANQSGCQPIADHLPSNLANPYLSEDDVDALVVWIENGAQNN